MQPGPGGGGDAGGDRGGREAVVEERDEEDPRQRELGRRPLTSAEGAQQVSGEVTRLGGMPCGRGRARGECQRGGHQGESRRAHPLGVDVAGERVGDGEQLHRDGQAPLEGEPGDAGGEGPEAAGEGVRSMAGSTSVPGLRVPWCVAGDPTTSCRSLLDRVHGDHVDERDAAIEQVAVELGAHGRRDAAEAQHRLRRARRAGRRRRGRRSGPGRRGSPAGPGGAGSAADRG